MIGLGVLAKLTVAYGITSGHSKLANWRLLFLVELGTCSRFLIFAFAVSFALQDVLRLNAFVRAEDILMTFVAFFFLPRPSTLLN